MSSKAELSELRRVALWGVISLGLFWLVATYLPPFVRWIGNDTVHVVFTPPDGPEVIVRLQYAGTGPNTLGVYHDRYEGYVPEGKRAKIGDASIKTIFGGKPGKYRYRGCTYHTGTGYLELYVDYEESS
jgi:hypothetical protein